MKSSSKHTPVSCALVVAMSFGCDGSSRPMTSPAAEAPGAPAVPGEPTSPAIHQEPSSEAAAEEQAARIPEASEPTSGVSPSNSAAGEEPAMGIAALEPVSAEPASAEGSQQEAPAAATPMAPPGAAPSPTFHVFLLLGQSNMAGYPKAQPGDRIEEPRVRVLGFDDCAATGRQTDVWDVAAPPLHECWNDGLGPGDYFAKELLQVLPQGDSIGLVPSAISGERIEAFLKVEGARYERLLQRARLAQQAGGVIEGILFHQGESNNGDPSWPGKVSTLVSDLRADLGAGAVPFLAGELLYSGNAAGHNSLVRQLPTMVDNARVISASGLVVDPLDTQWNLHFDHDSQVELGKRYARAMIEALGW